MPMATTDSIPDLTADSARPGTGLLVLLGAMRPAQLEVVLVNLAAAFPAEGLLVASPDAIPADSHPSLRIVAAPATHSAWTLTAGDFVNGYQLADKNKARGLL